MSLGLVLKPQILENYPVCGSRTALFFEVLKVVERQKNFLENGFFSRSPKIFFWRPFFWRSPEKFFWRSFFFFFFFLESTCACVLGLEHSCPWPREGLSSVGLFLALARIFLCPWPRALCPRLHLCKLDLFFIGKRVCYIRLGLLLENVT